jgi:hypothetical protein
MSRTSTSPPYRLRGGSLAFQAVWSPHTHTEVCLHAEMRAKASAFMVLFRELAFCIRSTYCL